MDSIRGDYLTKERAAVELGVSCATLDRWHRERRGPTRTKIGRTVLYRVDSLRAWLLAQEEALATRQ
ncbi:MAG: DNA-binding protein [Pseudomonadota bacterium]